MYKKNRKTANRLFHQSYQYRRDGYKSKTGSLLAGAPSPQVIDDMLRNCNNQFKNFIFSVLFLLENHTNDQVDIINVDLTILVDIS